MLIDGKAMRRQRLLWLLTDNRRVYAEGHNQVLKADARWVTIQLRVRQASAEGRIRSGNIS